jgi:single-stranded-DNA-specific exonuclease
MNQSELKDFKQFLMDSGYFEYAQGHANAFGVSIPDRNLSTFHAYANDALKDVDFGENFYDVPNHYICGCMVLGLEIAVR